MNNKDNKENGFLARVNIINPETGEILRSSVMMKIEESQSIKQLNTKLASLNVPNRLQLVEWVA
jgi:hypothetical protein